MADLTSTYYLFGLLPLGVTAIKTILELVFLVLGIVCMVRWLRRK